MCSVPLSPTFSTPGPGQQITQIWTPALPHSGLQAPRDAFLERISLHPFSCPVSYKESAHLSGFHAMLTATEMASHLVGGGCVAGD